MSLSQPTLKELQKTTPSNWRTEEYSFFGRNYIKGDNSQEGYNPLQPSKTLEERTKEEVAGIFNLLELKEGMQLLDLPCGYGRHSLELAKKENIYIVGGDINSIHLDEAKAQMEQLQKANELKTNISFELMNMLDIPYTNEFDRVINMFYSLGFFETDEENEQPFYQFYKALKPNGKLLIHTDVNPPRILKGAFDRPLRTEQDGNILEVTDTYDEETKKICGAWKEYDKNTKELLRDKKYATRIYTEEEFKALCLKVGFRDVQSYSYRNGGKYSPEACDMMIVATK
ncbi:MAG: methyltransferase domain-containing protein [Candidatus Peribacteria bacterium]|jgi:ubiquinone/menaquinone biosynthesis C-methylase UbiE|nr:methyltransferase domain-containing protein [Candidatus Peribacteria bacterium]